MRTLVGLFLLLSTVNAFAAAQEQCSLYFNSDFSRVTFVSAFDTPAGRAAEPLHCRFTKATGRESTRLIGWQVAVGNAEVELACDSRFTPTTKMYWIFNDNYGIVVSNTYKLKFSDNFECTLRQMPMDREPHPVSFTQFKITP